MKIAIPVNKGMVSPHFGHCEEFRVYQVNTDKCEIVEKNAHPSPPHVPGELPKWLAEKGVDMVLAGGMGTRAQQLFSSHGIKVLVGAGQVDADELVQNYLDGDFEGAGNLCDH
ncbi:MAG: NifB/NifX family molybdenum-iron cluster-binding protein [Planctomycetota bacterium]|nr:NifB/NifX family molybdenum-iron cluster-binding protein [Planctomycetota bacterium]